MDIYEKLTNKKRFGTWQKQQIESGSELLRLIEVGASCFNHYCAGYDDTQRLVLHSVHRRISLGYSIPTVIFSFRLLQSAVVILPLGY